MRYLLEHPLCEMCSNEGHTTPAEVVDHIIAHRGDSSLFWSSDNHRALCALHHNKRIDEGDFGR